MLVVRKVRVSLFMKYVTDSTEDDKRNTFDVRRRDSRGQITTEHNDVISIILSHACTVCKRKACILVKITLLKVSVIPDPASQDKLFH